MSNLSRVSGLSGVIRLSGVSDLCEVSVSMSGQNTETETWNTVLQNTVPFKLVRALGIWDTALISI